MIFMTEPRIIKETSSGTSFSEIRDEMFSDREILCVGEINSVTVNSLINQIRYLAKSDPEKEITMYINSPGGEVSSGLALYDVMKAVKCPIRTVCVGTAASMAAVLFASGRTFFFCSQQSDILVFLRYPLGVHGQYMPVRGICQLFWGNFSKNFSFL